MAAAAATRLLENGAIGCCLYSPHACTRFHGHFKFLFQTEEWQEGYRVKQEQGRFGDSIALGDFFQDVKLILQSKPAKKKKRKSTKTPARKLDVVPEAVGDENDQNDGDIKPVEQNLEVVFERSASGSNGTHSTRSDEEAASHQRTNSDLSFDDSQAQDCDDSQTQDCDESEGFDLESPAVDNSSSGFLSSHYHEMTEDDRYVARALGKSLGMAGDDPDIAEATRRLLESKVLSPEFFQDMEEGEDVDDDFDLLGVDMNKSIDPELGGVGGEDDGGSYEEVSSVEYLDVEEEGEDVVAGQETVERTGENTDEIVSGDGRDDQHEDVQIEAPETILRSAEPNHEDEGVHSKTGNGMTHKDTIAGGVFEGDRVEVNQSQQIISEAPIPDGFSTTTKDSSRGSESEGAFWAFDGNDTTTPSKVEPAPLPPPPPPPHEGTPLLGRKDTSEEQLGSPLKPSIFTTVGALAEEFSGDDDDGNVDNHKNASNSSDK